MAFPTARDALYGNPPAADHWPDKSVFRDYLESLEAMLAAGTIKGFADAVAGLPGSGNTIGDLRIVLAEPAADGGVYQWDGTDWGLIAALPTVFWDDAYARLSQDWSEGTLPGGPGTKSAKEHAADAEDFADEAGLDRIQAGLHRIASEAAAADAGDSRLQAMTAAIAAGAPIVVSLTTPVPADGTVELLLVDGDLQLWEVVSGAWSARPSIGDLLYASSPRGGRVDLRPAYLEQYITGFRGRGMLDAETINVTTEQAIAGSAAAGSDTVTVTDATYFLQGASVMICHDNGTYLPYYVSSKSGATLTIRPSLRYPVSTSSRIERTWYNRAHPGKFYMRHLAQRIAWTREADAAMPDRGRLLFTDLTAAASAYDDQLVVVGTATLNYFTGSALGSSADVTTPVRFPMENNAYVSGYTTGGGVETRLFSTDGAADCVAKLVFYSALSTPEYTIQALDQDGAVLGSRVISPSVDQLIAAEYTLAFSARGARYVKIRVTCTASAGGAFSLSQIDVFAVPSGSGLIADKLGARVVTLGDSWFGGDLGGSAEREPVAQQLALERPDWTVINAGVGGNRIWQMIARFETDVAAYNPDYVVVNTGTNESYNPSSATFDPNSLDYFVQQYRILIGKILAIGARPIIIGVPALAEADAGSGYTSWQLNTRARSYVRAFGRSIAARPLALGGKSGLEAYRPDDALTTGTTPSVAYKRWVPLAYASATTVTNLTGGVTGQIVTLYATNGNVTLQYGTLLLHGRANITLTTNSSITLMRLDTAVSSGWIEIARSIVPAVNPETEVTFTTGSVLDVTGLKYIVLDYPSPETITNFTGGVKGQRIRIRSTNSNPTLASSPSAFFRLTGLTNLPMNADDVVTIERLDPLATTRWIEESRSIK